MRDSTVNDLIEKVARKSYGQYLHKVSLQRVRSFNGAAVTFDFPVTALVGPNGGGKTTILGAAAMAYSLVRPRRFFAKSGKYDTSMQDWSIEYELTDKRIEPRATITRSAKYRQAKWVRRNAPDRDVHVFGVLRTLPASERTELRRCIDGKFEGYGERQFGPEVVAAVESILAKDAANYFAVDTAKKHDVPMYAARMEDGEGYSEFHFGAGEASVIRIVSAIDEAPENSLILIEEIENGLHPVATQRLVEYLIETSAKKSVQVIFTTHSNDALEPLPAKAVWAAYDGKTVQGKLDIAALRTLTGKVDARLVLFVEDRFAEIAVWAALRAYDVKHPMYLEGVRVHPLGSASAVETATDAHNDNPAITFPAVGILDGDQRPTATDDTSPNPSIVYFPGSGDPERLVFDDRRRPRKCAGAPDRNAATGSDRAGSSPKCSAVPEVYEPRHTRNLQPDRRRSRFSFGVRSSKCVCGLLGPAPSRAD